MKNYITNGFELIKDALLKDRVNRYLFSFVLFGSFIDFLIWHFYLSSPDIFVYLRFNIYPIQYLAIILLINFFLAVFSYKKEKEISQLLFIGSTILVLFIFALELFYLSGL